MKRLTTIAALVLCFGCAQSPDTKSTQVKTGSWRCDKFHGHTWIVYQRYIDEQAFVIHDPDCKCGWAVGPSKPAGDSE